LKKIKPEIIYVCSKLMQSVDMADMSSVSIYAQFVFFPDLAVQLVWIPVGAE
jgi:hypothetical protein